MASVLPALRRVTTKLSLPLIGFALCLAATLMLATPAKAQITFPSASPISAGNIAVRVQPVVTEGTQSAQSVTGEGVVIYGASPNLAIISENDLLVSTMADASGGGKTERLAATGLGDTLEEARYTIFQQDGIGSTFRIAPLVGVSVPTGMDNVNAAMPRYDQPGSSGWGGKAALTTSWQTLDWDFAAEVGYETYLPDSGYQVGNRLEANAGFYYPIWPKIIDSPFEKQLFLSMETNYTADTYDRLYGHFMPGTGGQLWLIDPGVMYTGALSSINFTFLLPMMQTTNGPASRYDFGFELELRWSFFTNHHW
ncbi:hypothetical protein [Acidiphilium sp.]|jgi:hypothetical protein|uniref:hypothetical protein n=1 Tax=Acidiphilium sp. TaxID=527 RepID=UPI00258F81F3|nr:hypothetical protein [Acidiphilium sp.]